MKKTKEKNPLRDIEAALRKRILFRAEEITSALIFRLGTVSSDLSTGQHRAALGGLDGIEREIATLRAVLLLLP